MIALPAFRCGARPQGPGTETSPGVAPSYLPASRVELQGQRCHSAGNGQTTWPSSAKCLRLPLPRLHCFCPKATGHLLRGEEATPRPRSSLLSALPARLRVIREGNTHYFDTPTDIWDWLEGLGLSTTHKQLETPRAADRPRGRRRGNRQNVAFTHIGPDLRADQA